MKGGSVACRAGPMHLEPCMLNAPDAAEVSRANCHREHPYAVLCKRQSVRCGQTRFLRGMMSVSLNMYFTNTTVLLR